MSKTLSIEAAEEKLFSEETKAADKGAGMEPKKVPAWKQQQELINSLLEARVQYELTTRQILAIRAQIDAEKLKHGWTDEDVQRFAAEAEAAASAGADGVRDANDDAA